MKHFLAFIFAMMMLFSQRQAAAQMLDDLFDEEELQSSEVGNSSAKPSPKSTPARKENPSSSVKAPVPVQASKGAPVQTSSKPTAKSESASVPASSVSEKKAPPKTFSLSTGPQGISLPQLGSGNADSLPNLGGNTKKKNSENLSLFEMRAKKTGFSDTNVLKFDIAGIRLKMMPEEVIEKAEELGFSIKFKDLKIPELNEWRYHRFCLGKRFYAPDNKKRCIREAAQNDNSEYVSRLVFENKRRRETLSVDFTSIYTENQAYRIRYVSKGDHSLGATEEGRFLKTKRRQEFLKTLIKKYGPPDEEQTLSWGIAGRGATLQAEISDTFLDASLVMEDSLMEENDFDTISTEEIKADPLDNFSF